MEFAEFGWLILLLLRILDNFSFFIEFVLENVVADLITEVLLLYMEWIFLLNSAKTCEAIIRRADASSFEISALHSYLRGHLVETHAFLRCKARIGNN